MTIASAPDPASVFENGATDPPGVIGTCPLTVVRSRRGESAKYAMLSFAI